MPSYDEVVAHKNEVQTLEQTVDRLENEAEDLRYTAQQFEHDAECAYKSQMEAEEELAVLELKAQGHGGFVERLLQAAGVPEHMQDVENIEHSIEQITKAMK